MTHVESTAEFPRIHKLNARIDWTPFFGSLPFIDHTLVVKLVYTFYMPISTDALPSIEEFDGAKHLFLQDLKFIQFEDWAPINANYGSVADKKLGIVGPARNYVLKGGTNVSPPVEEGDEDVSLLQDGYLNWANNRVRSVNLIDFQLLPGYPPTLLNADLADPIRFKTRSHTCSLVGNGERSAVRNNLDFSIPYGVLGAKNNGCSFYFEVVWAYGSMAPRAPVSEFAINAVYNTCGLGVTAIIAGGRRANNAAPVCCILGVFQLQNDLKIVLVHFATGLEHAQYAGQILRQGLHVIICDRFHVYFARGCVLRNNADAAANVMGVYVTLGVGNNKSSTIASIRPQLANVMFTMQNEKNNTFRFDEPGNPNVYAACSDFQNCGTDFSGWRYPWMQPGYNIPPGLTLDTFECTDTAFETFVALYHDIEDIDFFTGDILVDLPNTIIADNIYDLLMNVDLLSEENAANASKAIIGSLGTIDTARCGLRRAVMLKNYLLSYDEIQELHTSLSTASNQPTYSEKVDFANVAWVNFSKYYLHKAVDLDFRYKYPIDNATNYFYADNVDSPPNVVQLDITDGSKDSTFSMPQTTAFSEQFFAAYRVCTIEKYKRISDLPYYITLTQKQLTAEDEQYTPSPWVEINVEFPHGN